MLDEAKNLTTREKILQTALELFNEKGVKNVTTAQIAGNSGISEGNLWYHFRTKRDLVWQLFEMLEAEVDANLSRITPEKSDLYAHLSYPVRAFEYMWEYRFLFQDRFEDILNEDSRHEIQSLIKRGQQNIERILTEMIDAKMMFATPEQARRIAVNAWIIHSNWLQFLQARENITQIAEEHIKEGFAQLMSLFQPYYSPEARHETEKFLAEFTLKKKSFGKGE